VAQRRFIHRYGERGLSAPSSRRDCGPGGSAYLPAFISGRP
jgi:hypothetical protein